MATSAALLENSQKEKSRNAYKHQQQIKNPRYLKNLENPTENIIIGVFLDGNKSKDLIYSLMQAPNKTFSLRLEAAGLSFTIEKLTGQLLSQKHKGYALCLENIEAAKTENSPQHALPVPVPVGDAIFTRKTNTALAIRTADCIPILLYDEQSSVVASIHVSWHTLYAGILDNTLQSLFQQQQGLRADMLFAHIGPCIESSCYPVQEDFVAKFRPLLEVEGLSYPDFFLNNSKISDKITHETSKLTFDLQGFTKKILIKRGIQVKRIFETRLCTRCNPAFFSHRENSTKSRNLSFIALLNNNFTFKLD